MDAREIYQSSSLDYQRLRFDGFSGVGRERDYKRGLTRKLEKGDLRFDQAV